METTWINLDMMNHISLGNREYLMVMLEGALDEISNARSSWNINKFGGEKETVFRELHKLKTTFSMLQCSVLILPCQSIIDQLDSWPSESIINKVDELFSQAISAEEEIKNIIKE